MHVRGALRAHLDSKQVSRVIYGTVVGLALVVALEAHPPGAWAMAATLVATAIAVALAELYSEYVGWRLRRGRDGAGHHHGVDPGEVAAVAVGAASPAAFFVLAAVGLLELDLAFRLAKWSGLGVLCAYGYWAGRLGGAPRGRAALEAAAVGLVGVLVIAVKSLVH